MQKHESILIGEIDRDDEFQSRQAVLWPGRLLLIGFWGSMLVCLAALWFSGTLLSAPDQLLSKTLLQFIAIHRLLALLGPAVGLVLCYGALRFMTHEILGVRERYLDERQKMLRDQAHRSAFKLVKIACLVIAGAILLPHLPWFHTSAPAISSPAWVLINPQTTNPQATLGVTMWQIERVPLMPSIAQATNTEILCAGMLLFLCLWLIASALPMSVLLWKGKRV
ncbi:MAG TPA: hypothetical protein VFN35_05030 [Ktedonobacteraceae bacterium]|nr:hypothetical protein [Ktedonobacteraceae bacterium]